MLSFLPFLPLLPAPQPVRRLRVHKKLGTDRAGTADPRDGPQHVALCSAHQVGGRKRKEGMFRVMAFAFSSQCYTWWGPVFLEMAEHLIVWSGEWSPSFSLLEGTVVALHVKLPLCQPIGFVAFALLILSTIPLSGWGAVWGSVASWG